MKPITKSLSRFALLAVMLLSLLAVRAHAAVIQFETRVAGYSSAGWILVLPELDGSLGGRVRFDRARNRWITDRVQRGEPLRITVSPTTAAERADNRGWMTIYSVTSLYTLDDRYIRMPYVTAITVPTNPSFRGIIVSVQNSAYQTFFKDLPIGPRP